MQRVAETLYERGLSEAKMTSIERRLARFIGNSRIMVPLIWKLFLTQALTPFRGQHALSGRSDDCVSGTAGAFTGVASSLGRDASADQMGGGSMENRRTIVGPGACASARHILYAACRSRVSRHAAGQALHRSRLALSVARVCRAYLSALLPWQTRTDVEAL